MAEKVKLTHLDQPFSWLICLASCLNTLIIFGNIKSAGVFLVALHQAEIATRAQAALITVTTYGTFFAIAIIGGALIHLFGYRSVLISGSIIASSGTFCSYFVTDSDYLILTFGFLQGAGLGLCLIPNSSIIGYYFEKHRAKAFGLSFVGGPLGSLIFPPLCQFLIDKYLLRGAFLLLSAINLHMILFSAIIKDPPKPPKRPNGSTKEKNMQIRSYKIAELSPQVDPKVANNNDGEIYLKIGKLTLYTLPEENKDPSCCENSSTINNSCENDCSNYSGPTDSTVFEDECSKAENSHADSCKIGIENPIFISEDTTNNVLKESSETSVSDNKNFQYKKTSIRRLNSETIISKTNTLCSLIKIMIKNKLFYPVILAVFASNFSIVFFNLTMPDFAVSQGATPQAAAYLISIASAFDMFTRLTVGILLDKRLFKLSFSWAACLGLAAMSLLIAAIFGKDSYSILAFSSACYGFVFGACQVHFPVCIMHFLGPRFLPLVMGSGAALTVILTFNTAPLVTFFFSNYGSYAGIYYIGASLFLLCSIIWFGIGFFAKNVH
ncbi:Monocarboxylate transporter 14 [Nymphon striatum]|nr:Monocarboxylate transporter 14 [Nymphon striatum]